MAATPSLRVVKTFTYRGQVRQFSNRYHFTSATPADTAHWTTFSDAVVTAEKAILINSPVVTIVGTYGYAAGSDVPVFSKTYSTAGTFVSGTTPPPGDVAGIIRYATTARTAKNHPVYLYNYYHVVQCTNPANPDALQAALISAYTTYGTAWVTGFSDGTNTYKRAGPNGATATGVYVNPLATHRDLPR